MWILSDSVISIGIDDVELIGGSLCQTRRDLDGVVACRALINLAVYDAVQSGGMVSGERGSSFNRWNPVAMMCSIVLNKQFTEIFRFLITQSSDMT